MRKNTVLGAAALTLSAILLAGCSREIRRPISVMLAEGEGYTVEGDNPVYVLPGEDARFSVRLADGCSLVSCPGAVYADGVLTVPRVLYPATLTPDVRAHAATVSLAVYEPAARGHIVSNLLPGDYPSGTAVTLSAEADDGYVFAAWIDGDGETLSTDPSYSFTLDADTAIVARFRTVEEEEKRSSALLVYNMNGGECTLEGAKDGIYYAEVPTDTYKLPNSLPSLDYFVRDGYHLIEYNTKPDGTGDGYSPGSKILLDVETSAVLFCIWMKEADASGFTYTEKNGELTVTGYTGTESDLAIPEQIGGKPVTSIGAKAIRSASLRRLSLPRTLRSMEGGAVYDCPALTTVYFPDTIERVPDTAFTACPEYSSFYIYAASLPRYGPGVSLKFEALVTTRDRNRIIVVSGSSSWNGLDSKQLGAAFNDDYYVVNYGTNAGTPAIMYMEMISHFVHEGDIVVQAPEHSDNQIGSLDMTWKMYRETEMYYNLYRYIDVRRYTKMYSAYTEHQKTRLGIASPTSYTARPGNYDEHGDMITDRSKLNDPNYTSNFNISYSPKAITDRYAENLNAAHKMLLDAGAAVYFSFAPHNYNGLTRTARTEENMHAYTERWIEALNVPVISYLGDYTLAGQYIQDSDWHPNDVGREMRTAQLAKDMKAQMAKDGIWTEK